ncbi:MAG: hypothetical protein ACR2JP_10950 [Acidimicrobiia bacterium]
MVVWTRSWMSLMASSGTLVVVFTSLTGGGAETRRRRPRVLTPAIPKHA